MEEDRVSKAQARAKFSQLLTRVKPEQAFEPDSDEHDFCISITRGLPAVYSELAKEEPPKFAVKLLSTKYKNNSRTLCVWNSTKSIWIPLSQTKIFTSGSKSSKKKRVQQAFRTAIKGQIDFVRASTAVPFICPLTSLEIWDKSKCEVDHYGQKPFQKLLEQFLNLYSLHYDTVALDRKGDIKDADVFKAWYEFHAKNSDLRLVDKTANRKKGMRG